MPHHNRYRRGCPATGPCEVQRPDARRYGSHRSRTTAPRTANPSATPSIVLTRLSPLYFGGNQTACHLPRGRALNGRNNFCRDPAIWPQEEIACAILNLLPSGDFTLVGYVSRKPPREGIDNILA